MKKVAVFMMVVICLFAANVAAENQQKTTNQQELTTDDDIIEFERAMRESMNTYIKEGILKVVHISGLPHMAIVAAAEFAMTCLSGDASDVNFYLSYLLIEWGYGYMDYFVESEKRKYGRVVTGIIYDADQVMRFLRGIVVSGLRDAAKSNSKIARRMEVITRMAKEYRNDYKNYPELRL